MAKKHILWVNESSACVSSGFGVLGKEILTRLYNTGKYEILELAAYAKTSDSRNFSIPWKVIGSMPEDEDQIGQQRYASDQLAQFGRAIFEQTCLDFKADLVIDVRDHWMQSFELESPLRKNYKILWMPTVDGSPQKSAWLDQYSQVDGLLTYSNFGKKTLEKESGGKLKVLGVVNPGADHLVYYPMDKKSIRQKFSINPNWNILMTVMRNQKRKLYPDLIEMFAGFLKYCREKSNHYLANNTYLYFNTSYPDVGYDLQKYIMEFGLGHKVLMTYICRNCKQHYIDFFQSELSICKHCNVLAAVCPNTGGGVSREELAELYNIADLYIQYSIAEGYGIPCAEAKSCGVPTLAVDHSAMTDHVNCEGCKPIEVQRLFYEAVIETEQKRALPNNEDAINKIYDFFVLPPDIKKQFSESVRKDILEHHTYDRAAKVFEDAIDSIEVQNQSETWFKETLSLAPLNLNIPQIRSNDQFVDWCLDNILGRPDLKNSFQKGEWVKGLNVGGLIAGGGTQRFSREIAVEMFKNMALNYNAWENRRLESILPKDDNKISWRVL